ncbi:MAG: tetratricopeptide repeat protein [Deltaproteobacteria bacterium]|nr:tetratricopeptide repeat protein [Deltaproteobacteria bacterium]
MNLGKRRGTVFLVLALLLMFSSLLLSSGCQSLHKLKKGRTDDRWICPEYADLPLRQGQFEMAIEKHLIVLAQDPDNAVAHYHLGYAYVQLGVHADGISEYLKALDLGLVQGDLFYNLGMAYGQLGIYQQAEQAFKRAIEMEPEYEDNYRALGNAQLQQGHFYDAMVSCRKATELAPDNPHSWHCLALAAAKSDEVGESWNAVKELRKLDPWIPITPWIQFSSSCFPQKEPSVNC